MKTMTKFVYFGFASLAFACFAFPPTAHAVSPAPDGGYPGGNTAEGQNALLSLTTGKFNTAVGVFSLESNMTGNFNTCAGAGTLLVNTADENTATGAGALLSNTTGGDNTANGAFALFNNTTGPFNTAIGVQALLSNTTGSDNTATGVDTLFNNTTGGGNTANGNNALASNTTGNQNTAVGLDALNSNTTGSDNTAVGRRALVSNTGSANTAVGRDTLFNTTTGNDNIALGRGAGSNQTTGSSNIFIGDVGGAGVSNVIAIGDSPVSGTSYNKFFAGAIYGITTGSTTTLPVIIDNFGQLGTAPSAARFKKEIKPMDKASESVLALKPVTFQYKSDKTNAPQFGLVAEEVAKVNPDLVVRDKNGEIYSVRYDAVNAMLLNEFLKEHRRVQELEATVAQQHKDFEAALADLKGQIQRVSAQLELSKASPKTVLNNQ
jgi:hypothetical protein